MGRVVPTGWLIVLVNTVVAGVEGLIGGASGVEWDCITGAGSAMWDGAGSLGPQGVMWVGTPLLQVWRACLGLV